MYACFYCKRQLYVAILNKLIILLLYYYIYYIYSLIGCHHHRPISINGGWVYHGHVRCDR